MIQADPSGRRLARLRRAVVHPSLGGAAALGFALSASWPDPTLAIGLGPVTQQSSLGRSLRIVVPVVLSPGEDIGAECFRLAASDREVDGVPQLAFGRMSLERTSAGARLVITNAQPVNDPVVRVTVQAGCETAVRREYVLLMDPPPIEAPLVAAASEPGTAVAQTAAPPPVTVPARRARSGSRTTTAAAVRGAGDSPRAARKAAPPPTARTQTRTAAKRPVRAATNQPRLTVSSAAPAIRVDPRAPYVSDAEHARAQQELANAIEAETVVLRKRIVELTAMVERLEEEVRANELAQRAAAGVANASELPQRVADAAANANEVPQRLAGEAAKDASGATPTRWWEQNWPLFSAIVGLPLVLAAALLWRRRRQGEQVPTDWSRAGVASVPAVTPSVPAQSALQNPAAGVAVPLPKVEPPPPRKVPRRTHAPHDGASALAVSELLHVTEEARVYVALGHPERAIDVLNDHIRQVPRSMPAAWLMLLDLYHTSGRRQEFSRLAEEFHLHCNVQAPLWEDYRPGETDEGGLETFPHILRHVASIWRLRGCREYLEGLLYDNREGRRMGFPLAAYGEILLLLQILDAPPAVDIDSDLVNDGKLEPVAQRAPAAASAATGDPPRPSAPRRAKSADAAPRPAQRPLDLESSVDEAAPDRAKKLSS